jgi:hypothetical protein
MTHLYGILKQRYESGGATIWSDLVPSPEDEVEKSVEDVEESVDE